MVFVATKTAKQWLTINTSPKNNFYSFINIFCNKHSFSPTMILRKKKGLPTIFIIIVCSF